MTHRDHREPPGAGPSLSQSSNGPVLSPAPWRALDRCTGEGSHGTAPCESPPGQRAPTRLWRALSVPHSTSAGKLEQRSPAELIPASRGSTAGRCAPFLPEQTPGQGAKPGGRSPAPAGHARHPPPRGAGLPFPPPQAPPQPASLSQGRAEPGPSP